MKGFTWHKDQMIFLGVAAESAKRMQKAAPLIEEGTRLFPHGHAAAVNT